MKAKLPWSVRELCARYRTHRPSTGASSTHEFHSLGSLAMRVLLSPDEVLERVSSGQLLAIEGPTNGRFLFSSSTLDALRDEVIDFVAQAIATELRARGANEETLLRATQVAFENQFDLARGKGENVFDFARSSDHYDNDSRTRDVIGGATVGAGAAYLRGRAAQGKSLLGNPGTLGDAADSVRRGAGEFVNDAKAAADPLAKAVAAGRAAISKRGTAIWKSLQAIK